MLYLNLKNMKFIVCVCKRKLIYYYYIILNSYILKRPKLYDFNNQ